MLPKDVAYEALLTGCAEHRSSVLKNGDHFIGIERVEVLSEDIQSELGDPVFTALERIGWLNAPISLHDYYPNWFPPNVVSADWMSKRLGLAWKIQPLAACFLASALLEPAILVLTESSYHSHSALARGPSRPHRWSPTGWCGPYAARAGFLPAGFTSHPTPAAIPSGRWRRAPGGPPARRQRSPPLGPSAA